MYKEGCGDYFNKIFPKFFDKLKEENSELEGKMVSSEL